MPTGVYIRKPFTEKHKRKISQNSARFWLGKKMPLRISKMINIFCKNCKKEFKIYPSLKNRKNFCSKICRKTGIFKKCLFCQKEFWCFKNCILKNNRIYCSKQCHNKVLKIKMKGKNNYFYGKKHTEESKRKISMHPTRALNISLAHKKLVRLGIHPLWKGGISFEPYGLKFNKELKKEIRKRDSYRCKECNFSEENLGYKLSIHHIDYNKQNSNINNLVSLCRSCHSKTNFDRENWKNYYVNKIKDL